MTRPITILVLSLVLAGCGGELVSSGNWPSNRTLGEAGGTVSLDNVEMTVPANVLDRSTTFRIIDLEEEAPLEGALGPVYRIYPDDVPNFDARLTWHITIDDLPDGVFFVELAVACADGGEWIPLAAPFLDPVAGVVGGRIDRTGTFTLVQVVEP